MIGQARIEGVWHNIPDEDWLREVVSVELDMETLVPVRNRQRIDVCEAFRKTGRHKGITREELLHRQNQKA